MGRYLLGAWLVLAAGATSALGAPLASNPDGHFRVPPAGRAVSSWGALTFDDSHLHRDISGEFQTFPGVYYDLDGKDRPPVMIRSTDS